MTHLYYLRHIVNQIEDLTHSLTDAQFIAALPILSNASIGKHLRHVIDVFATVAQGAEESVLSFDKRTRKPEVENNRTIAIQTLRHWAEIIENTNLEKKIDLVSNFSLADENEELHTETTLLRELIYAIEHAIHHLAIIKIGVTQSFGMSLSPDFGVAPSTVRYQGQLAKAME